MKSFLENYAPRQPQKNSSNTLCYLLLRSVFCFVGASLKALVLLNDKSNEVCAQCSPGVLIFYDRFHMRGMLSLLFFKRVIVKNLYNKL